MVLIIGVKNLAASREAEAAATVKTVNSSRKTGFLFKPAFPN
jgi:hypothetical protein